MLLRALLLFLFFAFLARAVWRLLEGVARGAMGGWAGRRAGAGRAAAECGGEDGAVFGLRDLRRAGQGPDRRLTRPGDLLLLRDVPRQPRRLTWTTYAVRTEEQIRADIVECGRRLWHRGFVASNDGNISVRLDEHRLITTPTAVSKGFMTPDMMVITDLEGRKLAGERNASSELKMHLEVYRHRPDVRAVVHAHPPTATGFAVAGIPLDRAVLAEVITTLGSIPIADYATPSTEELPAAVRKYIKAHDGLLLANHGALAIGADVSRPITGWRRSSTSRPSAWWRARSAGSICSHAARWTGSRGSAACTASRRRRPSAPTNDSAAVDEGQLDCQVVQAPDSGGARLVADRPLVPAGSGPVTGRGDSANIPGTDRAD